MDRPPVDEPAEVTNWIRLSRKLARSDLWLQDAFGRGQAWVDLLMLANWKAGSVRIRGVRIDLQRGQIAASSVWLADRWKWSRGKVQRFLNELETDQRVVQQKNNVTNVLTILNYDTYQGNGQQTEQQTDSKRTANRTANGQQTDTQEEGKEGKEGTRTEKNGQEGQEENTVPAGTSRTGKPQKAYSTDFLNFWVAFPTGRKKSKGAAWTAWQKAIKAEGVEVDVILAKAAEYAMSDEGRGDYVKMPSTWLNQRCWEDDPAAWRAKNSSTADPRGSMALLEQRRLERANQSPRE